MSSINIQTADGLIEIGGKVTEEKIISALGYTPADKEDLIDNIIEDESGELSIADESGNVIMSVGTDGVRTTEIIANGIEIGKTVSEHINDGSIHVSTTEKKAWNAKSDFSGYYQDLQEAPNITEDESGELTINDDNGNAILQVDSDGLETTAVTAKSVVVNNIDIEAKLDEHGKNIDDISEGLSSHITDESHITAEERTLWNNKSNFSGDYNDLDNAPSIADDETGEVTYADDAGNVIAKINSNGLETTQVTADSIIVNGTTFDGSYNSLSDTPTDLVTQSYIEGELAKKANSSHTHNIPDVDGLQDALGNKADADHTHDISDVDGLEDALTAKANQSDLETHVNASNPHNITKDDVGLKNVDNTSDIDKPISAATQTALEELKAELSETIVSETEEWKIADNNGNVVAIVNSNGLETTQVTADSIVVNERDVGNTLDELSNNKANSTHTHAISDVTNLQSTLNGKASSTHTHAISDITELQSTLNNKADSGHAHDVVSTTSAGFMSSSDKSKLDGIAASADSVSFTRSLTSGTKIGTITINDTETDLYAPTDTTYKAATTSTLGLVKSGTDITVDSSGNVSVNDDSHNHVISNVDGLQDALNTKANSTHTHTISDVTNLESTLNNKVDLTSDQTITGKKTFSSDISVTGTLDLNNAVGISGRYGDDDSCAVLVLDSSDDEVRIINVADPVDDSDAANKNYVDTEIATLYGGKIGKTGTSTGAEIFNNYDANVASGQYSHAEGWSTQATGYYSHAEGWSTQATGNNSHAEGALAIVTTDNTIAASQTDSTSAGYCGHAEGYGTVAYGACSHAEGNGTTAKGSCSHAGGLGTIANDYQTVIGMYNRDTDGPSSLVDETASRGLFIVGIGTSVDDRINGFRINPAGRAYSTSSFVSSGADYAEYFEWADGNPNNEDRRGRFVTLDNNKIRFATSEDEYILGIVSAEPSAVGDAQSEVWRDMYLRDVFGSRVQEVVEVEETVDENGVVTPAHTERRWVLNPDYDPEAKYISREERPEWDAVGIVGKLVAVDDGTCVVNGYCYPGTDGIATVSSERTEYRVIERIDDTHVRIFIK